MDRPDLLTPTQPAEILSATLARIDGRGYKVYRDLEGAYELEPGLRLVLDHAQGDPFATPSRLRLQIDQARAGFSEDSIAEGPARVALADFLARAFDRAARERSPRGPKGPAIGCYAGGAEVLRRSNLCMDERTLELRFTVSLPAAGRRIRGREAEWLLLDLVPRLAEATLVAAAHEASVVSAHIACVGDQVALRSQLIDRGLVAFVADGAVLPRQSGVSQRPLSGAAVPFASPDGLRVELTDSHGGKVSGLGIPAGVTLLCGGGFHGKSTLLDAIARSVYDHRPGDGRERCVSLPSAMKLRAEQGRSISGVDISPFLGPLPAGGDPRCFSTTNASGSTSQAASIVEALEAKSELLLLDEDSSASNLLFQDAAMREFLSVHDEPIFHLLRRVRQLHRERGVSTVMVLGGTGEYFGVADLVLQMREFECVDATERARRVAKSRGLDSPASPAWPSPPTRRWRGGALDPSKGRRQVNIKCFSTGELEIGASRLDLRALDALVESGQTRAIGWLLARAALEGPTVELAQLLDGAEEQLSTRGFDALVGIPVGDLAQPRRQELAAALARLRGAEFERGH